MATASDGYGVEGAILQTSRGGRTGGKVVTDDTRRFATMTATVAGRTVAGLEACVDSRVSDSCSTRPLTGYLSI